MCQKQQKYSDQTGQETTVLKHLQNLEADIIKWNRDFLQRSHLPQIPCCLGESPITFMVKRQEGLTVSAKTIYHLNTI